jgi:galactose mutarotase-like enzyme
MALNILAQIFINIFCVQNIMSGFSVAEKDRIRIKVNSANGQLVSLVSKDNEFMHDGGSPDWKGKGWANSELIMFPVFGPVDGYSADLGGQIFSLDQHGIARNTKDLPFVLESNSDGTMVWVQSYDGRQIPNPKYVPGKEAPQFLNWTAYELKKIFTIRHNKVLCSLQVTNKSDVNMPYVIGWHPAFKMLGDAHLGIYSGDMSRQITDLEQVAKSTYPAPGALILKGVTSVVYANLKSGAGLRVSADFGQDTLVWTPALDSGMLCIENSTKFPTLGKINYFKDSNFEVLSPGKTSRFYTISLEPYI